LTTVSTAVGVVRDTVNSTVPPSVTAAAEAPELIAIGTSFTT
jgi:hypothetical protein